MSVGNYTQAERKIVYKIKDLQTRMAYHRKKYLDYDVKKQVLIHSLKGKYKPGTHRKKRR